MASTVFNPSATWASGNRFTATTETDIMLSNPSNGVLRWAITADDTAPAISAAFGHPVRPNNSTSMQLMPGERIWFAGANAIATLEV